MKKLFFLSLMFLLTSCFYSEMRVDYTVEGYDESEVFCWADYPYTQEEVGDSVVPYYKHFVMKIRSPEKYGIDLPKFVENEISAEKVFLVDEHGEKVELSVTIKSEQKMITVDLNEIFFERGALRGFLIYVLTPSIQSYEIEFKFEKKDGSVFAFDFKVNQERKKKRYFILGELLRM